MSFAGSIFLVRIFTYFVLNQFHSQLVGLAFAAPPSLFTGVQPLKFINSASSLAC
jgi:hypothetical protein